MFTRIYEVYTNHLADAMSFFYEVFEIFFTYTIDDLFNVVTDYVDNLTEVPSFITNLLDLVIEPIQNILVTFYGDATLFVLCFSASLIIFIVFTLVKWLVELIPFI